MTNRGATKVDAGVLDAYTGNSVQQTLQPGESLSKRWALARFHGWYEFVVMDASDAVFEYRAAGHLENGKDTTSDPLMGGLIRP